MTYHDYLKEHSVVMPQQCQPESRFWLFQGIEAAIFLVLAALLVAVAYSIVMRAWK